MVPRRLGIQVDEVLELIRSKQLPGWTTDNGRVSPTDTVEHLRQQLAGNESDELIRTYGGRPDGSASRSTRSTSSSSPVASRAGRNEDGLAVPSCPARTVDEYRAATSR